MTSFFYNIIFFSPPGGVRELKLRPFDSESKTTSDCTCRLFSKKITPNSYFLFYQYLKRPLLQRFLSAFNRFLHTISKIWPSSVTCMIFMNMRRGSSATLTSSMTFSLKFKVLPEEVMDHNLQIEQSCHQWPSIAAISLLKAPSEYRHRPFFYDPDAFSGTYWRH